MTASIPGDKYNVRKQGQVLAQSSTEHTFHRLSEIVSAYIGDGDDFYFATVFALRRIYFGWARCSALFPCQSVVHFNATNHVHANRIASFDCLMDDMGSNEASSAGDLQFHFGNNMSNRKQRCEGTSLPRCEEATLLSINVVRDLNDGSKDERIG